MNNTVKRFTAVNPSLKLLSSGLNCLFLNLESG